MTPSLLKQKVISERTRWIQDMLSGLRSLPLSKLDDFSSDPKNSASAESFLRRCLEALLDLGRHILAKGFGKAIPEYKEIARELHHQKVLSSEEAEKLRVLAGYRNRMVHFYHEISDQELFEICSNELEDIENILNVILRWLDDNEHMLDKSL